MERLNSNANANSESKSRPRLDRRGQASVEYMLVIFLIFLIFIQLTKKISEFEMVAKLIAPAKKDFAIIYKYGHLKTKGKEEGGYDHHPAALAGPYSRVFANPR